MKLALLSEDEDDDLDFHQDEADRVYNIPKSADAALDFGGRFYDLSHRSQREDGTEKEPDAIAVLIKFPVKKERYRLSTHGRQLQTVKAIVKRLLQEPVKLLRYCRNNFDQY